MDRFIERFAQELPRGARVADLGRGGGRDLRLLRERGLDPIGLGSAEALAVIAQPYSGASVVVGDLRSLPFGANVFDGVWASASIASQTGRYERTSRRDISRYASRRSLFWIGKIRKGRGSPPAPLAVRVEAIPTVELKSTPSSLSLKNFTPSLGAVIGLIGALVAVWMSGRTNKEPIFGRTEAQIYCSSKRNRPSY